MAADDPTRNPDRQRGYTRRQVLRYGAVGFGAVGLGGLLSACAPGDEELVEGADDQQGEATEANGAPAGGGELVMLSTQLTPVEEAEAMRNTILADFDGQVDFIGEEAGPFVDRVLAEAEAGSGSTDLIGALHGDFAQFADQGLLTDLSDLADELSDRGFNEQYLELGRFGGDQQLYIPWMQATYIMVARREALDHLPDGADVEALTYDDWAAWGAAIQDATGSQRLGFPAADDGLIHRFLQGYAYPSFTGGLNTTFAGDDAVTMFEWFTEAWSHASRQSLTYGFMQEPLLTGEVWVAWDHVARLVDAVTTDPEQFVAFPSPVGPQGLGFMPVVAGLAIPANAPDPEGARSLIEYLTRPETMATTLREVAFYPPTEEPEIPEDLEEGIRAQADAVAAQANHAEALPALLPIGLGEQDGSYNEVFRTTFESIVVDGGDPREILDTQAGSLQQVLDDAEASCWQPDPESDGVCKVG
jgi:multiple sugar transport system substrate-binding protein